jgi:hypothetical protein
MYGSAAGRHQDWLLMRPAFSLHFPARLSIGHSQLPFDPCIPARGTKLPDRPEWFHVRLIVQREGKTVPLWSRNGYDWSSRYRRIVEAALRHRPDSFVLDREAVQLGVNGITDFQRPAQPQVGLRMTPGFDMVAATTSGSLLSFAARSWNSLLCPRLQGGLHRRRHYH